MDEIRQAIVHGDYAAASLPVPESYRAVTVHADKTDMFEDTASADRDPRKSLHLDEVPTPSWVRERPWSR